MKHHQKKHVAMVLAHYVRSQHNRHQWRLDQLKERTVVVRYIALYASVAAALLIGVWCTRHPY